MRLRIPELLKAKGWTPYALSKASEGRVNMSTAYRLARAGGQVEMIDLDTLEALMDTFGVNANDLFEREARKKK